MAIKKKSTSAQAEARQHPRFSAPSNTLVIVSPGTDNEWKVQAVDISEGGMAFVYQGSPEDLDKSGVLKILANNADIDSINYDTVSDIPLSQKVGSPVSARRRGVKFKWMGEMKKSDLRSFMKLCCT